MIQQTNLYRGGVITEYSLGIPGLTSDNPAGHKRWQWRHIGHGVHDQSLEALKSRVDQLLDASCSEP